MSSHYLAIDLGAESGRVIHGQLADDRLTTQEIHRFPNEAVQAEGSILWNVDGLQQGIRDGLSRAGKTELPFKSVSCDSWGLDYFLFREDGTLMAPTYHYRDPRSAKGVQKVHKRVDWATIFAETGVQFMALNTIYQLAAEHPERIKEAHSMLLIADGINYLLSGVARSEVTLASTSQLYNPRTDGWSRKLIAALKLPIGLFPAIVDSGTQLGPIVADWGGDAGLNGTEVVAAASHDTGAAVAGIPAEGDDWAFISSGTWSLMGVELEKPVISEACRDRNFTNEMGVDGTVRLLKNIVGLWIVQECRRAWQQQGQEYDYATLTRMAEAASPFVSLIDPGDARFLTPGDMPAKIAAFCRETRQPEPADPGAFIRCAVESLALKYRECLKDVDDLAGRPSNRIHVVGGGCQNRLLNQLTANACGVPVVSGPVEATAAGNILVQALAMDELASLEEIRACARGSFDVERFDPTDEANFKQAAARFSELTGD